MTIKFNTDSYSQGLTGQFQAIFSDILTFEQVSGNLFIERYSINKGNCDAN